jgi:hypothetical protein
MGSPFHSAVRHRPTLEMSMRTKALLCVASLAAGVTATIAQSNVYSTNVVGYYELNIPANKYVLLANQLNTTNNTIGNILGTSQDGAIFQKFLNGYTAYVYDSLVPGWTPDGNATLNPGEGGFYKSPVATTLTFVGEVLQGDLTNTLPIHKYAVRSSMVPQAGTLTQLGFPAEDGDVMQTYGNGYSAFVMDDGWWNPSEPSLAIGQAFFYEKASTSTQSQWVRHFTVQ